MSKSNTFENDLLKHVFNNDAIALVGDATGRLYGAITPFTDLSPENLASAVWEYVLEAGFTAAQVARMQAAVLLGDADDLEGPHPSFTGMDGTTVRVEADYTSGTRRVTGKDGD